MLTLNNVRFQIKKNKSWDKIRQLYIDKHYVSESTWPDNKFMRQITQGSNRPRPNQQGSKSKKNWRETNLS